MSAEEPRRGPRVLTPSDLSRTDLQVNRICGEANLQTFVWQMWRHQKREYVPPLFSDGKGLIWGVYG